MKGIARILKRLNAYIFFDYSFWNANAKALSRE